ncbi:MAG: flagellar motor switch protein FliM [Lachnospiraceae bacterium]|nr:flagellar motor switch protein FliM [Lachnospiraceae bacterium]
MADVLSQSQIDELLRSMQGGGGDEAPAETKEKEPVKEKVAEETKYNKYDFYSPRKFTKEKMKMLTNAFENYARILTSQVNGIFRAMTDMTVLEVQEKRYYEYVNALHENDDVALIEVSTQDGVKNNISLLMHVTPGLILTLISHMLGGGDRVVQEDSGYRLSDVERALYQRVIQYFVQALTDGFSNYIQLNFRLSRVEENPSMLQEVGLDEAVAIIHLNVDVAGLATEKVKICIPGTLLEFIFSLIDSRKRIAKGFSYQDNRDVILDNIRYSKLPVTAQLAKVQLNLNDIYHLQVGDIIDLNKLENSSVNLYVGRQPWFTGRMGVSKKNLAVQIEGLVGQSAKEEDQEEKVRAPAG